MHPVAKLYFDLSVDSQKLVQVELCHNVYKLWLDYVSKNGICEYQETVVGTIQSIDYVLPKDAIEAVIKGEDHLDVAMRYLEPISALQGDDLIFNYEMEMAYYSVYNLFQFYISRKLDDSWVIVNQALAVFNEQDTVDIFKKIVGNLA